MEEVVYCDVKDNVVEIIFERKLCGGMVNGLWEMFKNDFNKDIINWYNFLIYSNMILYKKYEENEVDSYFSNIFI